MNRWRVYQCALIVLFAGVGCSSSAHQMPMQSYDYAESAPSYYPESDESYASTGSVSTSSSSNRSNVKSDSSVYAFADSDVRGGMAAPAGKPAPAPQASAPEAPADGVGARSAHAGGERAASSSETSTREESVKPAPLLIYNGTVLLALYDVAETQKRIVEVVELEGGWVSTRSTNQLILRVPAPKFRDMLDQLAKMGDLLDLKWQAEDVTAVVHDTRIRLDSALKMRERLEELLNKAENVTDALAIEEQLGRIILEIEQLQARLRGYNDRIAYSTITVEFRPKTDRELPAHEYSLPFHWLQGLGVNRLLQIPRR